MVAADMVLLNGKVATVDENFSFAQAIAVKDGWIINVGNDEEIKEHIGKNTEIINLEGKVVLPGAYDSHLHAAYGGLTLEPDFVPLGDPKVESLKKINAKLAEIVRRVPTGTWIIGTGFSSSQLKECVKEGQRLPNRWDFDQTTPNHPIMIHDGGLHDMVVNSRALELCGIDKNTPDLPVSEGIIIRDKVSGEPTGYFRDWGAQALVGKNGLLFNTEQIEGFINNYQKLLNTYGITSHTDMAGVGGDYLFCGTWGSKVIEAYENLSRKEKLRARVSLNVLAGLNGSQSYEGIVGGLTQTKLPKFKDKNWVRADAVKIFGDDGWRRDDFMGPRGYCTFSGATEEEQAEHLTRTILEVHRQGWQMGIHLTGGKGVDTVIAAFIQAQQLYPKKPLRHFIIHGDDITYSGAQQAAKYNIVLSIQPIAFHHFLDHSISRHTPKSAREILDVNSYDSFGMICAGGSDGPTLPLSWLEAVQFLVTRKTIGGAVYWPELACSVELGIKIYTIYGAYQNRMDDVCGSIEVNKLADFQVLGEDIFSIDKDKIGTIPVVMTICGGKIVHCI